MTTRKHDDESSQFWSCSIDGSRTVVSYGKVGCTGRRLLKEHGSADAAERYMAKLHREKLRKGYSLAGEQEGGGTVGTVKLVNVGGNPRKRAKSAKTAITIHSVTGGRRGPAKRKPEIIQVKKRVGSIVPEHAATLSKSLITEAKKGNAKKVRDILDQGADPNAMTKQSIRYTALLFAAENGHTAVCRVLLEYGATVDARDRAKRRLAALDVAVTKDRKQVVQLLVDNGASVNEATPAGYRWMPLHRAAQAGLKEMVSLLIDNGASVTTPDKRGERPLDHAATNGHMEVVKLLIDCGASVHATNKTRTATLLSKVAGTKYVDMARLLIERGALVNGTDKDGGTPLMAATNRWRWIWDEEMGAMVDLLLEKGASVSAAKKDGTTILHGAVEGSASCEVIQRLIDLGADVSATTKGGITPLCRLRRGQFHRDRADRGEVANLLVQHGASLTPKFLELFHRDCLTDVLLHFAASRTDGGDWDWPYIAQAVVDLDPTAVNSSDLSGRTPLHVTTSSHLARALINHGASVTATDTSGRTALSCMWGSSHRWKTPLIPCSIMAICMPAATRSDALPPVFHTKPMWHKLQAGLGGRRARGGGARAQFASLRDLWMTLIE